MHESKDGIRTKNYYECLYNGETDEDDNEYGTATTNDEYQNTPTTNNGLNNHTPSTTSSLHDISTLIPPLAPPLLYNGTTPKYKWQPCDTQWQ
jgi:hypothetical protein